jgi:hypothetical protein
MKPQDVVIMLALALWGGAPTYAELSARTGVSQSEAHAAVRRLQSAKLLSDRREVARRRVMAFLEHGLAAAFPATPYGEAAGVRTGAGAPGVRGLASSGFANWVWPAAEPEGTGLAVEPLHKRAPDVVRAWPELRTALALVDIVRVNGSARDVGAALEQLRALVLSGDDGSAALIRPPIDLGQPDALGAAFDLDDLRRTIQKFAREPVEPLVVHPAHEVILEALGPDLAVRLAAVVPAGHHAPEAGHRVLDGKGVFGSRELVFPTLLDAIVARRLADELEPRLDEPGGRSWSGRAATSSLDPFGHYEWSPAAAWTAFERQSAALAEGVTVVVCTDVQEFFASVDRAVALRAVARRASAAPDVVGLLDRLASAWGPRRGYGAAPGLPVDPCGLGALLAHAVLREVDDRMPDTYDRSFRRYVDDARIFVERVEDAARELEAYRSALAAVGLTLQHHKVTTCAAGAFVADRAIQAFDALDAAKGDAAVALAKARDPDAIEPLRRRALGLGARTDPGAAARVALDLLVDPSTSSRLSETALRVLEGAEASAADVAVVAGRWASEPPRHLPAWRIRVARTVGALRLSTADAVAVAVDAARLWVEAGDHWVGDGAARAEAWWILYKHDEADALRGRVERWAGVPQRLVEPAERLAMAVLRAALGLPAATGVAGHVIDSDHALWNELVGRASAGDVDAARLSAALHGCRGDRFGVAAVPTRCLPVVAVLARGGWRPEARAVVDGWLGTALEGEPAVVDPATRRHLAALRGLHERGA